MPRPVFPPLTQARLKELLHYDPETGHFTWRVTRGSKAPAGTVAGSPSRGYTLICVDQKLYKAHRLAFLYMLGSIPDLDIDHVNRDRSDNRWVNLRPATSSENKFNAGPHRDCKSGHRGVHWFKPHQKWCARGMLRGKAHHIGYFEELADAVTASEAWRKEHHGEFYSCPTNPDPLPRSPNPEPTNK